MRILAFLIISYLILNPRSWVISNLDLNQTPYFSYFLNKSEVLNRFEINPPNLYLTIYLKNQAYFSENGTIVLMLNFDDLIQSEDIGDVMFFHELGHYVSYMKNSSFDKNSEEIFADLFSVKMTNLSVFCEVLKKSNPEPDNSHLSAQDRCDMFQNENNSLEDIIRRL